RGRRRILGTRVPARSCLACLADRTLWSFRAWWTRGTDRPYRPGRAGRSLAPAGRARRAGQQVVVCNRIGAYQGPFTHAPPATPTRTTLEKPIRDGRPGPNAFASRLNSAAACVWVACNPPAAADCMRAGK